MKSKTNLLLLAKAFANNFQNNQARLTHHYAKKYDNAEVNPHTVLYETRDGQSIVDSPLAIFLELCKDPQFNQFKHIWVINKDDDEIKSAIPEEYLSRVTLVIRNTKKYIHYLLTAKYLINNATFQTFFVKKKEQIYINTWHGTPLKYMGFDIPGSPKHSQNVVRNLMMTDYFLSPNNYTSEIFANSYKLRGIYPGKIVESGYPRIDFTFQTNRESLVQQLKKHRVKLTSDKPVVLYTPTWKGTSIQNPVTNIEQTVQEVLYLKNKIEEDYQLLVKVHPYVYPFIKNRAEIRSFLVPDYCDANQILGGIDILVTDYSSIFFDYLVTDKPIIFYAWDKDIYDVERGMYLEEKDFPGPIAETIEETASIIQNIDTYKEKFEKQYQAAKDRFVPFDDGQVTKRVVNYIFKDNSFPKDCGTIRSVDSSKKKILIYPGNLANNGITSSFLNLMNNIDYQKYDVTAFVEPAGKAGFENLARVNENVRVLFKPGRPIYTIREDYLNRKIQEEALPKGRPDLYPELAFKRETNRLLGNLNFDVAIDFSGYGYYWAKFILAANARKKVVFQHNDLWSDSQKVINGRRLHIKSLSALFSIYYKFDRILSVSPMTMDINGENLKDFIRPEQLGYAVNTINSQAILGTEKAEEKVLDIPKNSVKRVQLAMKPKESTTYPFFKNLDNLLLGNASETQLQLEDEISVVAQTTIQEELYNKCLVNQKYVGWTKDSNLSEVGNTIFKVEDVHLIATVLDKKSQFVWSDLATVYQEGCITPLKYLANTYAFIDKKAKTLKGDFYHLVVDKRPIGWVNESGFARFHKISPWHPVAIYFKNQNKKKKIGLSQNYQIQENYVQINASFFELGKVWQEPKGTTLAKETSVMIESDVIYQCVAKMQVANVAYHQLKKLSGELIGWIESQYLSDVEDQKLVGNEVQTQLPEEVEVQADFVNPKHFNFVTMGRLSPEKNHQNLIEAFALFVKEMPNARLYILGEGVLKEDLRKQIMDLELTEIVHLLGYISEPYRFLEKNDVFVLSSIYEGQPMVLLEAMTLGMKILATDIPANINVLGTKEEYAFLTRGTSVDALLVGLRQISEFNGKFAKFDYINYNKMAVQNFYKEIE